MQLTVRLTIAINYPLICSSMHCLPACGSYMHALMEHSTGRAADTVTLFNVVLMHALTVAVLLNVRCFF